ncbi:hypothetical protein ACLOJK_036389 [Asimina triloba]
MRRRSLKSRQFKGRMNAWMVTFGPSAGTGGGTNSEWAGSTVTSPTKASDEATKRQLKVQSNGPPHGRRPIPFGRIKERGLAPYRRQEASSSMDAHMIGPCRGEDEEPRPVTLLKMSECSTRGQMAPSILREEAHPWPQEEEGPHTIEGRPHSSDAA